MIIRKGGVNEDPTNLTRPIPPPPPPLPPNRVIVEDGTLPLPGDMVVGKPSVTGQVSVEGKAYDPNPKTLDILNFIVNALGDQKADLQFMKDKLNACLNDGYKILTVSTVTTGTYSNFYVIIQK